MTNDLDRDLYTNLISLVRNFFCRRGDSVSQSHRNNHILFYLQTFAFDNCFWSMDDSDPKFAGKFVLKSWLGSFLGLFEGSSIFFDVQMLKKDN